MDGQCRFVVAAMAFKRHSLKFPTLCCDLYKEIMMTVCFMYIVILFLLLVGGEILKCDVMHFWEWLYFCHFGLHI